MNINNQVTTPEQTEELLSLGVSRYKASMIWVDCSGRDDDGRITHPSYRLAIAPSVGSLESNIPAFTVFDLIDMMPKEIDGFEPCLYYTLSVWWFSYHSPRGTRYATYGDTVIDVLVRCNYRAIEDHPEHPIFALMGYRKATAEEIIELFKNR